MLLWVLAPAFTKSEITNDRVYRKGELVFSSFVGEMLSFQKDRERNTYKERKSDR